MKGRGKLQGNWKKCLEEAIKEIIKKGKVILIFSTEKKKKNPSGNEGCVTIYGNDKKNCQTETLFVADGCVTSHSGANSGHFETSIIHFLMSEGVSEVSELANK